MEELNKEDLKGVFSVVYGHKSTRTYKGCIKCLAGGTSQSFGTTRKAIRDYIELDDGTRFGKVHISRNIDEKLVVGRVYEFSLSTQKNNEHYLQAIKCDDGMVITNDNTKVGFTGSILIGIPLSVLAGMAFAFIVVGLLAITELFSIEALLVPGIFFATIPPVRMLRFIQMDKRAINAFGESNFKIE